MQSEADKTETSVFFNTSWTSLFVMCFGNALLVILTLWFFLCLLN